MSRRTDALDLIGRVAEIDTDAAEFMLGLYRSLPQGELSMNNEQGTAYRLSGDVGSTFTWASTPQGSRYWSELNRELRLRRLHDD